MWSAAAGILLALTLVSGFDGEIFDVTTVFNADIKCNEDSVNEEGIAVPNHRTIKDEHCSDGIGYVHARTNANGLQLYDGLSKYIDSNHSDVLNLTCAVDENICSWDNVGWEFNTFWVPLKRNKPYFVGKSIRVKLVNTHFEPVVYLYFTSDKSYIRDQNNFFVVQVKVIDTRSMDVDVYGNCFTELRGYELQLNLTDHDGKQILVDCQQVYNSLQIANEMPLVMTFNFNEQNFEIKYDNKQDSIIHAYTKSFSYNSANLKYFSMAAKDFIHFKHSVELKELTSTANGSEMVSPHIQPDSEQLCLVIVYFQEAPVSDDHEAQFLQSDDKLQILSRNELQEDQLLYTVSLVKNRWTVKQFNIAHKKPLQKLVIRKIGTASVKIHRISSCNPEGRTVLPVEINSTNTIYRVSPVVLPVCGGVIQVDEEWRSLESPNYPADYDPNQKCVWTLAAPPGYQVVLKFHFFKLEKDNNCQYDYMEVRDGSTQESPLLGKYCGYNLPPDVHSTGNKLLITFVSDHSIQEAGFSAVFMKDNVTKDLVTQSSCENGGVLTSAGCACPAGFYGPLCRHGCGRNRFGMDCGARCSMWNQECEGLKLCTYFTGCHCAPGYAGESCENKCSLGFYGNDCSQQCGTCGSSSACDIYTGMCGSCAPGYVPPYCKEVYPYGSFAPFVFAFDTYGSIEGVIVYRASIVQGVGTPKHYQLQYREKGDVEWEYHLTNVMSNSQKVYKQFIINGLNHGVVYQVRMVLMDDSFNKYDGDLVPIREVVTKCYIPDAYDYGVTSTSEATSITFSWSYQNKSEEWCPEDSYEVSWKTDWQWVTSFTKESLSLKDLLPGTTVEFKVRAKTIGGFAPFSNIVHASTSGSEPAAVVDLHKVSAQNTSALIPWQPALGSKKNSIQYTIAYKCVDRVACSPGCDDAPEGTLTQEETSVTLSPLLPFTKYLITVTPADGLDSSIYVGTSESIPTEIPRLSSVKPVRSNTSVTVFWDEEPVCSGFLQGYNYELTKKSDSLKILTSGFTEDREMTFKNLTASTEYQVKVFVVTVAGWNPDYYLMINTSTSAPVPTAVQNFTIYKLSRTMLGLRWAEPRATNGKLKSFTATHTLGQRSTSHVIEPTRCVSRPHLYCHSIEGLKSNRKYNVTVSARNMDVEEDGEVAFLTGFTKETSPAAPENLRLLNSSSTSVGLEWGYPSLANGVVRSFLVNVEETEQYDQDSCCQVYPLLETPVQEEQEAYRVEVSGLHPASTYYVSVTAKTVALGPSQPLVVYTRPPHLPLTLLPSEDTLKELMLPEEPLSWSSSDQGPEVNNSDVYSSLIQGHIILAVLNSSAGEVVSGVENSALDSLIREHISHQFYFVAEYNEEGLVSSSAWGQPPCPLPSRVSLAVAQITEYNGVYNVNIRLSNSSVTFSDCL